jgi:nicotinamide-nucleotide amidase
LSPAAGNASNKSESKEKHQPPCLSFHKTRLFDYRNSYHDSYRSYPFFTSFFLIYSCLWPIYVRAPNTTFTGVSYNTMARLVQVASRIAAKGQTVAVAETSAGGKIASYLLGQPGSSRWFVGGCVAYSKASKSGLLDLQGGGSKPTATEPHALELANAIKGKLGTDWAIGETGVAGPTPNSRGVSPGVCAIAVVGPGVQLTTTLYPDDVSI